MRLLGLLGQKTQEPFHLALMEDVEQIYVKIIEELALGERIDLLVDDEKTEDRVSSMLRSKDNVVFHKIKTSDVWVRDYSPIFVKNSNGCRSDEVDFQCVGEQVRRFEVG